MTTTPEFDAAEERARLASADLAAAANEVIARHSVQWRDAGDEVVAAYLSRPFTYYRGGKLKDARDDLDFATRAQAQVATIAATVRAAAEGRGAAGPSDSELVRRLVVLAEECERKAIGLRS